MKSAAGRRKERGRMPFYASASGKPARPTSREPSPRARVWPAAPIRAPRVFAGWNAEIRGANVRENAPRRRGARWNVLLQCNDVCLIGVMCLFGRRGQSRCVL